MIALKLTKCGYGNYDQILQQDVNKVLEQFYYENFCVDYENTMYEINKES
jgi:hypothetical protein